MDSDSGHSRSSHHSTHSHRSRRKDKHRDKDRDRDRERETDRESDREHGRRRSRSRDRHRDRDHDRDRGHESDASHRSHRVRDRSVTIRTPPMMTDEERPEDEVIEVQILPQDDNWGENTTVITGATSEYSVSNEDLSQFTKDMEASVGFDCSRYIGGIVGLLLGLVAVLTPIAFLVIPLFLWEFDESVSDKCNVVCQGLLISFSFKLVILLIGSIALFFRKPKATLPRVFWLRALVMLLIVVFIISYWLFYGFRIIDAPAELKFDNDYESVVAYSLSLVDALLFIHYLAIVLLEIRQMTTQFTLKVIRTNDGESRFYNIGELSIQRAAAWVLEQYYRDFHVYNPYLQHLPSSRAKQLSSFKFYDVDGGMNTTVTGRSRAILAANARRRDAGHNDRFYEEQEYERRVKKRKARLVVAAEESFTHIKRMNEEHGPSNPMDPYEAAQAIFPSMARALQKYLRITRQQPRWTMESVLNHLATCIGHNFTPKAFLEQFFNPGPPILEHIREGRNSQPWELICDQMANWPLKADTTFLLRQGDVSLLVYVMHIPHFQMSEEAFDHKNNKFVLRLQSETSV
ncbi:vang-like protein 2 [Saccoglossus kowalevskii]|uniref:Vang-like protein n=2 Tax=Saccoglossus kowalevskii TaxID=10224 RepID=A0ABM0M4P1_SACKO|nr:PREDICTED: vang-like protein 2-like isoform X1 [Saccoglossus kowalevskii]XP_006814983.1 PREDICTED: vang-like protein 2-like isoform X2 [Saccoglossus kowalevskii]